MKRLNLTHKYKDQDLEMTDTIPNLNRCVQDFVLNKSRTFCPNTAVTKVEHVLSHKEKLIMQ